MATPPQQPIAGPAEVLPDIRPAWRTLMPDCRRERGISLAIVPAVCCIFALYNPVVRYFGKDLKTLWPLLALWVVLLLMDKCTHWRLLLAALSARQGELLLFIGWMIVLLINTLIGRGISGIPHLFTVVTTLMILLIAIYYSACHPRGYRFLSLITLAVLAVETTRSLPVLFSGTDLTRRIVLYPSLVLEAAKLGLQGYDFYLALAIVFPCFLAWALTSRGLQRILLLIACGPIALAVMLATYTVAFYILLAGIGSYVLFASVTSRHPMRCLGVLLLVVVGCGIIWSTYLQHLDQVQFVTKKASAIFTGITESGIEDGETTGRGKRLMASLHTFENNPLWGIGPYTTIDNPFLYVHGGPIGGHASWFDQLAEYGFLGFGFYIVFFLLGVKRIIASYLAGPCRIFDMGRLVSCLLFVITGFLDPIIFGGTLITTLFYFFVIGFTPLSPSGQQTSIRRAAYDKLPQVTRCLMRGIP
ncbi:MAG: O-antigen ligase family protein [Armatimonadota bacterium]